MDILLQALLLVLGFAMLVKGADWFVDGSSSVAAKLKIPQLVIGLTVVAMGTSAPEAAVSITAALKGSAEITIGNIVGSNILNILIILGISSVITALAVAKSTVKVDIPFMTAITVMLLVMGLDGKLGLIEGIIMLLVFAGYLTYLIIMAKKNPEEQTEGIKNYSVPVGLMFTAIGLALIVLGSKFTVDAATELAREFGISERFIGLTIVALGTSLPELFTSVVAARKGNADIAIGNIVGSNIFNILFVVGLSALITPVPFAKEFIFDTAISIAAAVLLFLCCFRDRKLSRAGGIIMLISYAAYFVVIL